jgi:hypothetical protein
MNNGLITLHESFNESKMQYIMDHKDKLKNEINFARLEEYYKNSKDGVAKVTYEQMTGCCRWSPSVGRMSLQVMPTKFRDFLTKGLYRPLHMVNSRPVILEWLCAELGIRTPCITDFNKNYNVLLQCLTERGYTKSFAYKCVLAIINSGSLKVDDPPKWMVDLRKEISGIHRHVMASDPDYESFAKKNGGKDCIQNYMSHLMINQEQKILLNMWKTLDCNPSVVLMHNWIMVPIVCEIDLKKMKDNIKGLLRINMELELH